MRSPSFSTVSPSRSCWGLLTGNGDELGGRAGPWASEASAGDRRPLRFIPNVEGLEIDVSDLDGYPVAIAHGSLDPVIPVDWGRAARDLLVAAGADVEYHESPVPHTIDPEVIPALRGFFAAAIDGRG
jgi:hypothetical protein